MSTALIYLVGMLITLAAASYLLPLIFKRAIVINSKQAMCFAMGFSLQDIIRSIYLSDYMLLFVHCCVFFSFFFGYLRSEKIVVCMTAGCYESKPSQGKWGRAIKLAGWEFSYKP